MSDRIHALTVALKEQMTLEEAQELIDAIKQFRNVIAVEPNVSDSKTWWAYEKARLELGTKLWDVLYPKK